MKFVAEEKPLAEPRPLGIFGFLFFSSVLSSVAEWSNRVGRRDAFLLPLIGWR